MKELKNIVKCVHSSVGENYLFQIKIKELDFFEKFPVSKIHKHIKLNILHSEDFLFY